MTQTTVARSTTPIGQRVVIRRSLPADRLAIDKLAVLSGSRARPYESYVAELDGRIVAATSLDGRITIADPLVRTDPFIAALKERIGTGRPRAARARRRLLPALPSLRR